MVRGWTPSGVLGYDCLPRQKKFRDDIGVRQKIKVKIFSSVTIILKLNMEHMKVRFKLEFLTSRGRNSYFRSSYILQRVED